jgi:flagellar assembly protein FliH
LSSALRGFLRAPRRADAVTIGVDGRLRSPDDPLSGTVGGTPEETRRAADIVAQAQQHAEELVRGAATQAHAIQQRAHREGYQAGYAAGAAQARSELAAALDLVRHAGADAKTIRDQILLRCELEMVEMVIEATGAILGERVRLDAALVEETVRRALQRAGSQNVVRVRVHPQERDRVLAWLGEDRGDAPAFAVLADGSVGVGGCIVDTAAGRVDARLDVQLDEVARTLRAALPEVEEPGA